VAKWVLSLAFCASIAASIGFGSTADEVRGVAQLAFFASLIGFLVAVVCVSTGPGESRQARVASAAPDASRRDAGRQALAANF
jgi:uncharacterized membrane protein YtjA (UPF0391 family)